MTVLQHEFVSEKQYAGEAIEDYAACQTAVNRVLEIVNELDAIRPGGRAVLLPLLQHAHPGVRATAGTFLCRVMPEQALPVLRKLAGMNMLEELTAHHGLNASSHAQRTIWMYEDGKLEV